MSEEANIYPKFAFDASKVIIYGGGGLSKMIIESVRVLGCYQIIGVIDDNLPKGTDVIGSPVLGGAEVLPELYQSGVRLAVNSVGGIGNYKVRLNVFTNWRMPVSSARPSYTPPPTSIPARAGSGRAGAGHELR
jgi:hypothetical protein